MECIILGMEFKQEHLLARNRKGIQLLVVTLNEDVSFEAGSLAGLTVYTRMSYNGLLSAANPEISQKK